MLRRFMMAVCVAVPCGQALAAELPYVPVDLAQRDSSERDRVRAERDADRGAQGLANELRELAAEARRRRAAEDWVLDEMDALARRHDSGGRRRVLFDNFRDGNYTSDPSWQVVTGRFRVERALGLVSSVAASGGASERRQAGSQDLPMAILGAILEQKMGPAQSDLAEIHTPADIGNAFGLTLSLSSMADAGQLEVGTYQGRDGKSGYRLVYYPGRPARLELLRLSGRGSGVIQVNDEVPSLEDGRPHTIEWSRGPGGEMRVTLDGRERLRGSDRGVTGRFDGVTLINRGGEYGISEIAVYESGR